MLRKLHFSSNVQNRSGVVMFTYSIYEYTERTQLHNINFMFQSLDIEPIIQKIDLRFTKSLEIDNVYKLRLCLLDTHICLVLPP